MRRASFFALFLSAGCTAGSATLGEPLDDAGGGPVDTGVLDATDCVSCDADAGVAGDSGDPYSTPLVCSSNTNWTSGNRGSSRMRPGAACIACHTQMGGPAFQIGGTVYPTAHEPDDCNGASSTSFVNAQVVITGADGTPFPLTINRAGNFYYEGFNAIQLPFTAKVTYMGRERAMTTPQMVGDCNSCHTEMGANNAPGRIMMP